MTRPKVTIYVPSHNYGRFLEEAVDSVLRQTLPDWELILIDDGSSDDTPAICARYVEAHPDRIRSHRFEKAQGLRVGANWAIENARGEYIMRLDADDYLDENALLVLANWLDRNPDCALVYPNWVYVSEEGDFLGIENRKRVGDEVEVLDLPAHGACTMVRRRVMKAIGGYDPEHDSQDGHELWLKIIRSHQVGNVSTPLFFYRQHGSSMSVNERRMLDSRQRIKRRLAQLKEGNVRPKTVAIIPARRDTFYLKRLPLMEVAGRPLIDYTIDEALDVGGFDTVCVSTDDEETMQHCAGKDGVIVSLRLEELRDPRVSLSKVLLSVTEELESKHQIYPDIVVMLGITAPLRHGKQVREALDTLQLYDVDCVMSVTENTDLHFVHDKQGLRPLSKSSLSQLRFERDALLVGNGALYVTWRDHLNGENLFEGRVGHIVMPREDSLQLRYPEDVALLNSLLINRVN